MTDFNFTPEQRKAMAAELKITVEEFDKRVLFIANLEFFRSNLGLQVQDFTKSLYISKSHYDNFRHFRVKLEKFNKLTDLVYTLNELIEADDALHARFPQPIIATDLYEKDLRTIRYATPGDVPGTAFYSHKFIGNYITYYTSTNTSGEKQTQFGIMRLRPTDSNSDFTIEGVFSIKTYEDALSVFEQVNTSSACDMKQINPKKYAYYHGTAHITLSMLWINMTNLSKSECVSMSFDVSSKILTKNPDKDFYGARGIALAQSSGQGNQTVTFPIVLTKKELACSEEELNKYLHFTYSKIDSASITQMVKRIVSLMDSLNTPDLKELQETALDRYLRTSIANILNRHVYNSHYFLPSELDQFYRDIIVPIRNIFDPTEE